MNEQNIVHIIYNDYVLIDVQHINNGIVALCHILISSSFGVGSTFSSHHVAITATCFWGCLWGCFCW